MCKQQGIAVMMFLVAMVVYARDGEDYDWMITRNWTIEMTGNGEIIYWHSHEIPNGTFRKFDIPEGTPIYRGLTDFGRFNYYYPVGTENMVRIGYDDDGDGIDDVLAITTRDNYSYFMLRAQVSMFIPLGGGDRKGEVTNPEHPFVGEWLDPDGNPRLDVRLVEYADYRYFLQIDKIPGFAYKQGWYLLKYLGNGVFESESSFEEGRIRLEVQEDEKILMIPLFEKPEGSSRLAQLKMRSWEGDANEYAGEYPEDTAGSDAPVQESAPMESRDDNEKTEPMIPVNEGVEVQIMDSGNSYPYIIGAAAAVIVVLAAAAVLLLRKRRKAA